HSTDNNRDSRSSSDNICNSICCINQHRFRCGKYSNSTCNSHHHSTTSSQKKAKTNHYGRVYKKAHSTTATE
ncbi:hypothetical protein NQZ68_031086, partial [Dissostichus eleginoides]